MIENLDSSKIIVIHFIQLVLKQLLKMEKNPFNDDGKLDIYCITKVRNPLIKKYTSVLFIQCNEMKWKTSDINGLCISIFLNYMEW